MVGRIFWNTDRHHEESTDKKIGRALLQYHEQDDVFLDVECFIDNRPLCFVGEEFDRPVLIGDVNSKEYRRIILWRKIISKISFYYCDFEGFMG